jgi:hypothetical protein
MLLVGAATMNGMRKWWASTATPRVPILLATSPLAATRSVPTSTARTFPSRITVAAMLSQMTVTGMPFCLSS